MNFRKQKVERMNRSSHSNTPHTIAASTEKELSGPDKPLPPPASLVSLLEND